MMSYIMVTKHDESMIYIITWIILVTDMVM